MRSAEQALWTLAWLDARHDLELARRRHYRGLDPTGLLDEVHQGHPMHSLLTETLGREQVPPQPDEFVPRTSRLLRDAVRNLGDPPFGLYCRGDLTLLRRQPAVGVVGSREPRVDAGDTARSIAYALAAAGVVVVSGLARGVDGIAHTAALDAGGMTVAVLGSGLDNVYPAQHRSLAQRVLDRGGLLVSEYSPQTRATPKRFPSRNRLIAALCDFVVVVQARHESGSMQTVDHALQLGVEAGAVPSFVGDVEFAGSEDLLRSGARAIFDAEGVLLALGIDPSVAQARHEFAQWLRSPRSPDELAVACGAPVDEVLDRLLDLELEGLVDSLPDGRYRSAVNPARKPTKRQLARRYAATMMRKRRA